MLFSVYTRNLSHFRFRQAYLEQPAEKKLDRVFAIPKKHPDVPPSGMQVGSFPGTEQVVPSTSSYRHCNLGTYLPQIHSVKD